MSRRQISARSPTPSRSPAAQQLWTRDKSEFRDKDIHKCHITTTTRQQYNQNLAALDRTSPTARVEALSEILQNAHNVAFRLPKYVGLDVQKMEGEDES